MRVLETLIILKAIIPVKEILKMLHKLKTK
jgi:hypothetical protein